MHLSNFIILQDAKCHLPFIHFSQKKKKKTGNFRVPYINLTFPHETPRDTTPCLFNPSTHSNPTVRCVLCCCQLHVVRCSSISHPIYSEPMTPPSLNIHPLTTTTLFQLYFILLISKVITAPTPSASPLFSSSSSSGGKELCLSDPDPELTSRRSLQFPSDYNRCDQLPKSLHDEFVKNIHIIMGMYTTPPFALFSLAELTDEVRSISLSLSLLPSQFFNPPLQIAIAISLTQTKISLQRKNLLHIYLLQLTEDDVRL